VIAKGWIWKPIIAGLAGTSMHALFLYLKTRSGILPSFQPYQSFQLALSRWIGADVPAFARINRWLPGKTGAGKGLIFGVIGWILMGLVFFPLIGLGPFATGSGHGIAPALMSLAMLLTYSVVLGTVYATLETWER